MKYRSLRFLMTICVLAINVISAGLTMLLIGFLSRFRLLSFMAFPQAALISCIIIGSVISVIVYRHILKPIDELIRLTEKIRDGDYTARVDPDVAAGSIRVLITRFNEMAQRLGSVEMLKTDFIGTFSHEFKTPMVSIRGFAKQLKREDLTAEERTEYINIIIAESERLTNMSTNVLLLSRFENQKQIENTTDFDLPEQIRHCILLLERAWEDKGIEWDVDLDPLLLRSDPSIIEHIWINLFSNAVKFSPPGSTISVTCRRKADCAHVTVTDCGAGMDGATAARIFDKFYQGDPSHHAEGNGLGLSIVHRIVTLAKGKIKVDSLLGKGTTFTVILPLRSADSP